MGLCRAFEGSLLCSLHCCSCDLEISTWAVRNTSCPGHPQQGVCIYICLSGLVVQAEIVVCQAGNPAMTGCIQLGCCKQVGQGIIVCIHIKINPYNNHGIFDYHPLEGEELQLVCWVVGLSLVQAPTAIGYYSICAIPVGLVENSSQTRPTGISMELEMSGEICIGKNRQSVHSLFRSLKTSWHLLSHWMQCFSCQHSHPNLTPARVRLSVQI